MHDIVRTTKFAFLTAVLLLASGAFSPLWIHSAQQDASLNGDSRLQFLWIAIYAIVAACLLTRWRTAVALLRTQKALLLLTITCFVSASWSENPEVTLRKSAALAGTTLVGLLFAVDFSLSDQIGLLGTALATAAIASTLVSLFLPQIFPPTEFAGTAWNGVFSHKNLLGRTMSLGTLGLFCVNRTTWTNAIFSLAGIALCAIALFFSHSQTAVVVTLGMILCCALSPVVRWRWREALGLSLLLTLCASPLLWIAFEHPGDIALFLHRNATLTGRSRIWTFASLSFAHHPWLGYGYGGFWWISRDSLQALAWIGYKTPHAHNGFLDLGLQLGIVGLLTFAAVWLLAFRAALRKFRTTCDPQARWPLLYLLFLIFYSVTESSLLVPNSLLWILFVAAICSTSRDRICLIGIPQ